MLTRRFFSGCALCTGLGLIAASPDAQAQQAATQGVTRKLLRQNDVPGTGFTTIQLLVEILPGSLVARHTHPGHEGSFVIEGGLELVVQGEAPKVLTAGDSFLVPPATPHGGRNGPAPTKLFATFVVEKDKPLASPAPE